MVFFLSDMHGENYGLHDGPNENPIVLAERKRKNFIINTHIDMIHKNHFFFQKTKIASKVIFEIAKFRGMNMEVYKIL